MVADQSAAEAVIEQLKQSNRRWRALALAACAAGVDGLFMETHPDPAHAPSDGPNMMPIDKLDDVIRRAVDVWACARR